ncbi:MAG: DNA-3-methyladenine glycosylase 2 family protein [Turneriella sp.]|nr:DNA-3-methyladenine glycosylase 2 family protein [Leptospiraceae bacterium]MCX7633225.1 DNA-3-methyladenine glycosylase 2 family protein [Turneriella sp.]
MIGLPPYWHEGMAYLALRDSVLAQLFEHYPLPQLKLRKDAFTTLARAISGQQISVKAADAVWQRFVAATGGRSEKISPHKVLALPHEALLGCGLSRRKVDYIRALAEKFVRQELCAKKLSQLSDHEVRQELLRLKGVGIWTADMFLIFNLWRPNIFPREDLGLIRAIANNYCRGRVVSRRKLDALAARWSPYATIAVWYLWRSLDPYPVEY